MLRIGDKLPHFTGINQDGINITSEIFFGNKLVVFFYPKANTPGCTAEVCDINSNFGVLLIEGFNVIGISADSVKNQKKFHTKYALQYDLIADENRDIIEKFGVWKLKKFMGREFMGIVRTTFLFDENLICTSVIEKVKTKDATSQIIEYSKTS